MKLSLRNYQAWENATVTVEGFTAVVGPSNRGKSSFGRAAIGALRNGVLPNHIKIGTEGVEVTLTYRDLDLRVTRGAKAKDSAIYYVGGEKFEKLGGDVPAAVKAMNFGPIEVNGVTIDPLFASQFDSQFLLSSGATALSAVLNAFSSTEKLDRGRKELQRRTNDINASAKALAPQISGLEEQEASLGAQLTEAEPLVAQLTATAVYVARLERTETALGALEAALVAARRAEEGLQATGDVERSLERSLRLFKALNRVTIALDAHREHEAAVAKLRGIEQVEAALAPALRAQRVLQALAATQTAVAAHDRAVQQLQGVEEVEEALKAPLRLYKALVRVKAVQDNDPAPLLALAKRIDDLSTAPSERLLRAGIILEEVFAATERLDFIHRELSSNDTALADLETLRVELQGKLDAAVAAAVTCPKCGHQFNPKDSHEH